MLPSDPAKTYEALMRWTRGNVHAADFLREMSEIARLADDIVDEASNRQRNVSWLLSRSLVALPLNPFFAAHAVRLGPLISTIIVKWRISDEYRVSGDRLKQVHGFVMREAVGDLVTATASILGGDEFAKTVADDFFQTCHAGSIETVQDWVEE